MAVLKQFGILFVLGIAGIAMVTITSAPLVEQQLAKLSPETLEKAPPLQILMLLQGLQLTVLLAISILIGIGCAYRVGLSSHLIDHWVFHTAKSLSFAVEMKWSLGVGAAAALVLFLLDRLMQPALPEALRATNTEPSWLNLLTAMLYGGITEEILMRWGLMSLLVWIAWKGLKTRHYVAKPRNIPRCDCASSAGIWTFTPARNCRDSSTHSACDYPSDITQWDCWHCFWLALLAILA
jgi:hypothetical protein